MKPKFVILEYGVAEGATNPFGYDPWALFPAWPKEPLSDEDYWYNDDCPFPIKSSRHMAEILGVVNKYRRFDFEIVALQYENAKRYLAENRDSIFVVSASVGAFFNDEFMAEYKNDFYMCISAGNEGPKGEGLGSEKPYWTSIGAITPDLQLTDYSSWGRGLVDYVGIAGEYVPHNYFGQKTTFIQGTSYACPQHATQIMNLMMSYHEKNGTKPPIKWVLSSRDKRVIDVSDPGLDLKTGYGIYLWSPLDDIPTEATLFIGNPVMTVGTKSVTLTVAPKLDAGTTLVPLRAIAEALNAEVTYDKGKIIIRR